MKRIPTFLLMLSLGLGMAIGQNPTLSPVIVVMKEKYDDTSLSSKTIFMDKQQRRDFVIRDKKAFCQASQREVMDFLGDLQVEEVKSFWSFNGFSCLAGQDAIRQLSERKDVAKVYLDAPKNMIPEGGMTHPATSRSNGWHIDHVNAPQVWNYNGTSGYTGNGVVVAMLDSGLNYNHIDIVNSLWDGGPEYPHHGYDIINGDDDPLDDHGHGSHTAGIVAGRGVAGTVTGIAPDAKLMILKVINAAGEGDDADLIAGCEFAMEHGADIMSISLCAAGAGACSFYRDLFSTALEAGVVVTAAAGNEAQQQYAFPIPYNIGAPGNCPPPWLHPDQRKLQEGGLSAVISVGAIDSNDTHCDFSSVGPVTWSEGTYVGDYHDYPYANGDASQPGLIRPDISAPGANITSLNYATNNGYIEYDGTSMATPCVSGVLALLLEADPELSPAELDSIIELTSVKAGNNSKNNRVGAGRVDALAAMNALFHHGPTNLTASYDGYEVSLSWDAAPEAVSYQVFRDGIRIANNLSETAYTDQLPFGGSYTYYVVALLANEMTSLPSNYVTVERAVEVSAEVIDNRRVALSWDMPACLIDGFESGDFYQNMWLIDQTYPWVISTENPFEGTYCAKSTNTGMFTTSKISLAVNVATSCMVSYFARISCFPLNGGGFFIDNVQMGETIKGEEPWDLYTAPLSPGNHILEWKYANQLGEGGYENAFYIDNITVGSPYCIYRADCDGSNQVLIANNVASTTYVDHGWDALPLGQYKYGISNDEGNHIAWSECLDKDYMAVTEATSMDILVYPNPAQDQVTIAGEGLSRVTVVNTLGQVVLDQEATSDIQVLSLEDYPSGIYFVNVVSKGGTTVAKLCVNR